MSAYCLSKWDIPSNVPLPVSCKRIWRNTENGFATLIRIKNNAKKGGAVIIVTDEATFRQPPTLPATWAPRGCQPKIPTRGERHS